MTEQELQQLTGIRPKTAPTPPGQASTPDELFKQYGIPYTPSNIKDRVAQGDTGYFSGMGSRTGEEQIAGAQKIASSVKKGADNINKGYQLGQEGHPIKGFGKTLEGLGQGAFGTIIGAAQSALAPISAAVSPVLEGIGNINEGQATKLQGQLESSQPQWVKDATTKTKELIAKHPDAAQLGSDIINTILLGVGGGEVEAPVSSAVKDSLSKEGLTATKESLTPPSITDIKKTVSNKYIASEKTNWGKPTEKTASSYNNATKISNIAEKKGTDIPQVLVDNGIKLSDNVTAGANGKQVYDTAASAEKLREDAAKISTDLVRPSLREADMSNPAISSKGLKEKSIANIRSNPTLTPEMKQKLISDINRTPFRTTYTREGLLDEKIVRDKNAKYNQFSDTAQTREAIKNKAIADAARSELEANVPAEIPVGEVHGEAAKLYQAADYLDALHTKPVPRSIGQRIANSITKIGGAVAGESLGGGLLGGVGGYHFGGILERAFENMTDPVKRAILNSMERQHPEVFNRLKSYLGEQETARLSRQALPAAGESSAPMVTPAPTTYEAAAKVIRNEATSPNVEYQDILDAYTTGGLNEPELASVITKKSGLPLALSEQIAEEAKVLKNEGGGVDSKWIDQTIEHYRPKTK